jgi:hypothetical protein
VEGTINSWAGKGKLTGTQKQQLTQILDDVHQRILAKQAIHNDALDRINGAASRDDIIRADKEARQKLNELSQTHGGGNTAPPGADNEVYVKGQLVGHTVQGKYVPLAK